MEAGVRGVLDHPTVLIPLLELPCKELIRIAHALRGRESTTAAHRTNRSFREFLRLSGDRPARSSKSRGPREYTSARFGLFRCHGLDGAEDLMCLPATGELGVAYPTAVGVRTPA